MKTPFETIRLGALRIPNRIAMAPIKTALGTTTGQVTEKLVAYFARRARGGVGLIICEPLYVDKGGQEHPRQLGIDADDKQQGLRLLVDAVHAQGARIFAHLNHAGRAANPKAAGRAPVAPSKVACRRTGVEPAAIVELDIAAIVQSFADAARRAQQSGFDGVELQFGLGYLVAQFLSPATNRRSDAYGGDPERRARFAREVYQQAREAVGADFPVGVRISASEKSEGGLDIGDAQALARDLSAAGVDLIHVATGSNCDSLPWYFQHMALPAGVNETLAAQLRQAIATPVMAAGRLGDPARIREVIGTGMVDMVALGRPLLADPDLPKKMAAGRDDEVLLCGHCLQGCFAAVKAGKGIGCHFNPAVGRELDDRPVPAPRPKRVVVVGGGPAGMQAALTAHRRGHAVTLVERDRLGGRFRLAAAPPHKERLAQPLAALVAQVESAGITIERAEADRALLAGMDPEAVIIATGSRASPPEIEGLRDALTAEEVLAGTRKVGDRALVLGGGMVGMEVAETLANAGKRVVLLELLEAVGGDMDPVSRAMMLARLAQLPVEILTETELELLDERRALVSHRGEQRDLGAFASVVVCTGNRPFAPLASALRDLEIDLRVTGDAAEIGTVGDAIRSGHAAGAAV